MFYICEICLLLHSVRHYRQRRESLHFKRFTSCSVNPVERISAQCVKAWSTVCFQSATGSHSSLYRKITFHFSWPCPVFLVWVRDICVVCGVKQSKNLWWGFIKIRINSFNATQHVKHWKSPLNTGDTLILKLHNITTTITSTATTTSTKINTTKSTTTTITTTTATNTTKSTTSVSTAVNITTTITTTPCITTSASTTTNIATYTTTTNTITNLQKLMQLLRWWWLSATSTTSTFSPTTTTAPFFFSYAITIWI